MIHRYKHIGVDVRTTPQYGHYTLIREGNTLVYINKKQGSRGLCLGAFKHKDDNFLQRKVTDEYIGFVVVVRDDAPFFNLDLIAHVLNKYSAYNCKRLMEAVNKYRSFVINNT